MSGDNGRRHAANAAPSTPLTIPDLQLPLLPYQEEAFNWAVEKQQSYLAMDMGLGKTAVAIAIATALVQQQNQKVLIVVPPSLIINWELEIAKFSPNVRVTTLRGKSPYQLPPSDIYIIGNAVLYDWVVSLMGQIDAIIVDEAHFFKNASKRTKSLVNLSQSLPKDSVRVLMSGTPAPNGRNLELVTQIDTLGPNAWVGIGGVGNFYQRYAPWSGITTADGRKVGRTSSNDLELKERMHSTFMFRRKREDVIDLPPKFRNTVVLEGEGDAVLDYIECEDDLIAWLDSMDRDTTGAERAYALVQLGYLRKHVGRAKAKAMIKHVSEILDNEPGGVFIVAEHVDTMNELVSGLAKYNVSCIRGGMTQEAKNKAVVDFNSGISRVLVGQIISAGTGLTLTGDGKNKNTRGIIAQLPWNPASLKQAEDRLHRISQTQDVHITIPLCHIDGRTTVDERLWAVLEEKAFATGILIDGEAEVLLEEIQNGVLDSYKRKKPQDDKQKNQRHKQSGQDVATEEEGV